MFEISLNIPAKALLFGEYGLLYGGKGVGCVLPNLNFEVDVNISDSTTAKVIIESRFFDRGKEEFLFSSPNKDSFFYKAISPWEKYLTDKLLYIKVKKSFSPSLGFGSSAAMITAISYALTQFITGKTPALSNPYLWKYIRQSLYNTQKMASGYDVGIQLAYLITSHSSVVWNTKELFWTFQNTNTDVPMIQQLYLDKNLITKLGCFVKTHVYSDTTKVLKNFNSLKAEEKQNYSKKHTDIVDLFLSKSDYDTLLNCMHSSKQVAKEQGIYIEEPISKQLSRCKIPFKTMGSGFGDCLWVAADPQKLIQLKVLNPEDIAFNFYEFVN